MKDLFADDKSQKPRDRRGRFATAERAYADRILEENKRLRLEVEKYKGLFEKYFRAWKACVSHAARVERKLKEIADGCY